MENKNVNNFQHIDIPQQAGVQIPDEFSHFTYFSIDGIKREMVKALQKTFADPVMPIIYHYNENSELSQIAIYENRANRLSKRPCISVISKNGDASMNFLGNGEFLNETDDAYNWGGIMTLDLELEIRTKNVLDNARLTAIVVLVMRFLFIQKFRDYNLMFNKIRISGEEVEGEDREREYINTITTHITSDFTNTLPKSLVTTIQNIDFNFDTTI
jgi:hypothetical protein